MLECSDMETDIGSLTVLGAAVAARLHIDRQRVSVRHLLNEPNGRSRIGEVVIYLKKYSWLCRTGPDFIREHTISEVADGVLKEWNMRQA